VASQWATARLGMPNGATAQGGRQSHRFNLSYGGAELNGLETLAARVTEFGWNAQIVAPGTQLTGLESRLSQLPSRLAINQMGHVPQ
jgi:D-galactarolactone isomerase